ncbi:MAG: anti-sigma factor antagonist [Bacilli bacterium]|nr:anti-sigma factor antagonist [Bacilli bacterium]
MELVTSKLDELELTLFLFGRIDSTSTAAYEAAINKERKQRHTSLVLDFKGVEYISSAGLRLMLKLAKAEKSLRLVNTSAEVYNVFEMTGFTQILNVSKALREISIEGCPLIGKGAYGKVYRIADDTIIKSYFRGNPIEDIERERELAREAFVLGIPTAISFDIVKVKEECYGAVYEMIGSDSLMSALLKHPENYDTYVSYYVELLDKLRNTETDDPHIPLARKDLDYRLGVVKGVVGQELFQKIERKIHSIKDKPTLVHGDCHFKNVFVSPEGLILIDMDTICKGDPIIEIANLYRTYLCFEEIDPGNTMKFFSIDPSFTKKLFFDVYDRLYKENRDEELPKVRFLAYFLLLSHYAEKPEKYATFLSRVKEILEREIDSFESF